MWRGFSNVTVEGLVVSNVTVEGLIWRAVSIVIEERG